MDRRKRKAPMKERPLSTGSTVDLISNLEVFWSTTLTIYLQNMREEDPCVSNATKTVLGMLATEPPSLQ
jgi:hypothetical protein